MRIVGVVRLASRKRIEPRLCGSIVVRWGNPLPVILNSLPEEKWMRAFLVAAGLVLNASAGQAQQQPRDSVSAAQVTVIGNDYAFTQLPATIPAGQTLFAFENRGKVRHEMSVMLLKPGITLQQVLELTGSAT